MMRKSLIFKTALLFTALFATTTSTHAKTFFVPKNAAAQKEKLNGDYETITKDAKNFATNENKKRLTPREIRKQQQRQNKANRNSNKPATND